MNESVSSEDNSGGSICYFLVCWKNSDFVSFLIASLYRSNDLFLIHCDSKSPAQLTLFIARLAENYGNVIQIESGDYSWAGYSHVKLSLEAITTGLNIHKGWSHFVFLSEQHLPLQSPDEIASRLQHYKSILRIQCADEMRGAERADVLNRFAAKYRELPGVGSFATRALQREEGFLAKIFHGSNWMILHRSHCLVLCQSERRGLFEPFRDCVHAEETAIQSTLAHLKEDLEQFDSVIIASPHLVDNNDLVMTDDLFEQSLGKHHFFIRKRQVTLSPAVEKHIRENHYFQEIEDLLPAKIISEQVDDASIPKLLYDKIVKYFSNHAAGPFDIGMLDAPTYGSPALHVVISNISGERRFSIRVVSENLTDFKVCLIEENEFNGTFEQPYVARGNLFATLRVRVFGLFGHREILPLDDEARGFVSISPGGSLDDVRAAITRLITLATPLPADYDVVQVSP